MMICWFQGCFELEIFGTTLFFHVDLGSNLSYMWQSIRWGRVLSQQVFVGVLEMVIALMLMIVIGCQDQVLSGLSQPISLPLGR